MTLVIAGERSGVGKTTITLAILSFLTQKGYQVQSFKVGPDYIDPMFHSAVTGSSSYNLDPILTSLDYLKSSFNLRSTNKDLALVEGVMGLFDGLNSENCLYYGSTAHVALILDLPVVLVLDCAKLSGSVAAIAHGFRSYNRNLNLVGVILNRVASQRHLELIQSGLESISMPVLGVLFRQDNLVLPERHLGLVPAGELDNLSQVLAHLVSLVKDNFNWDILLPLLKVNKAQSCYSSNSKVPICSLSIAIAKDKAFSFYYPDQLENLEALGAKLIPWSPLHDFAPPENCSGFLFGGGFPEVFAEDLSANEPVKKSILSAIQKGLPTYAECGGLIYLSKSLKDHQQNIWPMVGAIGVQTKMTTSLTLGYRKVKSLGPTDLFSKGTTLIGHEFHYSQIDNNDSNNHIDPLFSMSHYASSSKLSWQEGYRLENLQASYLHLHFGQSDHIARKFLNSCAQFSAIS